MGSFRTLLAISVLITHSRPIFGVSLLNGDGAIICFFIVSGFLMALILTEKYTDVRVFYINRALRIYPPFWAAVLLTVLLGVAFNPEVFSDFVRALGQHAARDNVMALIYAAVANTTLIGADLSRTLHASDFSGIVFGPTEATRERFVKLLLVPQSWTLTIELLFYAAAPFICRLRTPWLAYGVLLLMGLGSSLSEAFQTVGVKVDDEQAPFVFHFFVFGVLSYRIYRDVISRIRPERLLAVCIGPSLLVFAFVLVGAPLINADLLSPSLLYALIGVCLPFLFIVFKNSRWDAAIGELSYPIYLFHFAVVSVLRQYSEQHLGLAALLITVALSILYITVVDRRIQALRTRVAEKSRDHPPSIAAQPRLAAAA